MFPITPTHIGTASNDVVELPDPRESTSYVLALDGDDYITALPSGVPFELEPGIVVDGGRGADTIFGSTSFDILIGGAGNDFIQDMGYNNGAVLPQLDVVLPGQGTIVLFRRRILPDTGP